MGTHSLVRNATGSGAVVPSEVPKFPRGRWAWHPWHRHDGSNEASTQIRRVCTLEYRIISDFIYVFYLMSLFSFYRSSCLAGQVPHSICQKPAGETFECRIPFLSTCLSSTAVSLRSCTSSFCSLCYPICRTLISVRNGSCLPDIRYRKPRKGFIATFIHSCCASPKDTKCPT